MPTGPKPELGRRWRWFARLPIRHKLLALVLLPLLVVLPLLGLLLLVWSSQALDRLLVTKVRSDLAVAHGYFERVLAEVGASTAALAESQRLHAALASAPPATWPALLDELRQREGLDFLNLRATDGRLLATHHGLPDAEAQGRAPSLPVGVTSVEVLPGDTLALLAPALQGRVAVPLRPTRNAAPSTRTQEDRAMVLLSTQAVPAPGGGGSPATRPQAQLQGGVLLNRNLNFIDHINAIVYPEGSLPFADWGSRGTATLFLDDVRISTNVRLFQDGTAVSGGAAPLRSRAIGTRVSQTVRDAVLGRGVTWLDRAFVVNDWYVSAYQPLTDGRGQAVGMLYVGFLERPFTLLKYASLAGIGVVFFSVMAGAAVVSLRWARDIARPLERMEATMQCVEGGDLSARVGPVAPSGALAHGDDGEAGDEITRLAAHLDELLATIQDNTQALQRWNAELDAKVAERSAQLQAAQDRLVSNEKLAAVGQLTASIAHEVNNPIAVIQGNLDLVRELLGAQGAAPVQAELALIDAQIERMRLIVTQLLQFARPTEFAGYVDAVDAGAVLQDSLVLVKHLLARSHIDVHTDLAATHTVALNRQELQQVLVNLMVNAIQAMPQGGRLDLATRDVDAHADTGVPAAVDIVVADTGPGIPPDLLPTLFQPFVTRKKDGTGLGLWISRNLVERYGGSITAANRAPDEGAGAVFTLRLRVEGPPPA